MVAWKNAVAINTAAGYRAFLAKFPDSDLSATARKLEQRLRNRPEFTPAVAAANAAVPQNVALAGPTCPCTPPASAPALKKVEPINRLDPDPPRRVERAPPKRVRLPDDDVVVVRRPPPREVYDSPPPPPVSIGIGIGLGGFGGGRGGHYGDRRGGY